MSYTLGTVYQIWDNDTGNRFEIYKTDDGIFMDVYSGTQMISNMHVPNEAVKLVLGALTKLYVSIDSPSDPQTDKQTLLKLLDKSFNLG